MNIIRKANTTVRPYVSYSMVMWYFLVNNANSNTVFYLFRYAWALSICSLPQQQLQRAILFSGQFFHLMIVCIREKVESYNLCTPEEWPLRKKSIPLSSAFNTCWKRDKNHCSCGKKTMLINGYFQKTNHKFFLGSWPLKYLSLPPRHLGEFWKKVTNSMKVLHVPFSSWNSTNNL